MRRAGEEADVSVAERPSSCTRKGRASSRETSSVAAAAVALGPRRRRLPLPSSSTWGHWRRAERTRGAATRRRPATRSPGARVGRPSSARFRRWRGSARRRRRGAPVGPRRRPEKKNSTRRGAHLPRPRARAGLWQRQYRRPLKRATAPGLRPLGRS